MSAAAGPQATLQVDKSGIAFVALRNPPVNALQPQVLESLFSALKKAQSNPDVKAIVITGASGKFCAGFDFTLFGTPAMAGILERRGETLAQLAALVENGSKPTVAAIEGVALGGGLELAMACNARVAAQGALLGLPEVRLGLLPGLGGTQRLPRLVGIPQALNLMLSGSMISAEDAVSIGLVDQAVAAQQLLPAATQAALELVAGKAGSGQARRRHTLQLTQHMAQSGEGFVAAATALQEALVCVQRSMAGQRHYELLLAAVADGLAKGAPAGLQTEGEGFNACCKSGLHRQLLWMFQLGRAAKKARGPAWVYMQVLQFFGLAWIWIYVNSIYVWTAFMVGYDKARGRNKEKKAAAAAAGSGSSKEAAGRRTKAK